MIACPWCDEDADLSLTDADAFECADCGTRVDLLEEVPVLEMAA